MEGKHADFLKVKRCMDENHELNATQIAKKLKMLPNRVHYWVGAVRKQAKYGEPLHLKNQHLNRAQWYDFRRFWSQNPWYFQDLFGCENTEENMHREWKALQKLKFYGLADIPDNKNDSETYSARVY